MDIDTIRCRNEAIERDSILVSLEPVGVEIKQLSEPKFLLYQLTYDGITILIIIVCYFKIAKEKNV